MWWRSFWLRLAIEKGESRQREKETTEGEKKGGFGPSMVALEGGGRVVGPVTAMQDGGARGGDEEKDVYRAAETLTTRGRRERDRLRPRKEDNCDPRRWGTIRGHGEIHPFFFSLLSVPFSFSVFSFFVFYSSLFYSFFIFCVLFLAYYSFLLPYLLTVICFYNYILVID